MLEKLSNLGRQQCIRRVAAKLEGQRIDVDDPAFLDQQESLILPCYVQGFPRDCQQVLIMSRLRLRSRAESRVPGSPSMLPALNHSMPQFARGNQG
jgi:hypothetical protein